MDNIQEKNKIFIYLLVIFFAIFIGSGIFLLVNKKTANKEQQSVSTQTIKQEELLIPSEIPKKGLVNLKATGSGPYLLTDQLIIDLFADSNGENVTAYDVLVKYEPLAFDFIKAVSLDQAFQVYSFKKDDRLTLTVVKTSQDQTPSVFVEKPVVRLSFKPKKSGEFDFAILNSFNKETTKFVNEKTEVIYPKVNKIKLTVN